MRFFRLAATVLLSLLIVSGATAATRAQTAGTAALTAPQDVRGFLLRADEPSADTFTRTPSFAWKPVVGAVRYEFQLATARTFAVWLAARPQEHAGPGRLAEPLAALDLRHSVLALRAGPRDRAQRDDRPVERLLRLQHALVEPADSVERAVRIDPVVVGRRRDRLPGLVPRPEPDLPRRHERRRRARVLHLPSGSLVDGRHPLAHPRAAHALRPERRRHRAQRPARDVLRPVEPDVHDDEHSVRIRRAVAHGDNLRQHVDCGDAGCAPSDAGVRLQRRHRLRRREGKPLPRVRLDRSRLRQHRLPRRRRRRSRLCAALERHAFASRRTSPRRRPIRSRTSSPGARA